ncbi:MAG: oligosaccharide flippase family protein [Planctomycetota bacterium]
MFQPNYRLNYAFSIGQREPVAGPLADGAQVVSPVQQSVGVFGITKDGWNSVFAVFDQGAISATRFFTTLTLGYFCSDAELGIYAVGITVLLLAQMIHESLIVIPYSMARQDKSARAPERLYSDALIIHFAYSLVATLVVAFFGLVAITLRPDLFVAYCLLLFALPASLLAEFIRRCCVARLNVRLAMWLSIGNSLLQTVAILILLANGLLNATAVFLTIGICSWAISAYGLYAIGEATHQWKGRAFVKRCQEFLTKSRWLVASQVVAQFYFHTPVWFLAFFKGEASVGHLAAYMALTKLLNPVVLGLSTKLCPTLAQKHSSGGSRSVRGYVVRYCLSQTVLVGAYGFALFFIAEPFLLYGFDLTSEFSIEMIVLLLIANVWFGAVSMALYHALNVSNSAATNFKINLVAITVCLLVGNFSIPAWGALGVIVALLSGNVASTSVQAYAFFSGSAEGFERG